VQLVSKISNLCDHDPPTLQTDRRTDRRTDGRTDDMQSQYRAMHYSASRGENGNTGAVIRAKPGRLQSTHRLGVHKLMVIELSNRCLQGL